MSAASRIPSWRETPGRRLKHTLEYRKKRTKNFAMNRVVKTRGGLYSLHNMTTDLRWGGLCGGAAPPPFEDAEVYGTSSIDYAYLPRIFHPANGTEITADDVLVDIGCGKGRVINWWLSLGLGNRIIGIEHNDRIAGDAARRLAKYPNVEIIAGDATEQLPSEATKLFLFNPFRPPVIEAFKDRVCELYSPDASLVIVYYLALHLPVWERDPRFTIEPLKTKTFNRGAAIRLAGAAQGVDQPEEAR